MGDVVVVQLRVEPRRVGYLPKRTNRTGELPVQQRIWEAVGSGDPVPRPDVTMTDGGKFATEFSPEPRLPQRGKRGVKRLCRLMGGSQDFAQSIRSIIPPCFRVRTADCSQGGR
jgi:hypothetical protein